MAAVSAPVIGSGQRVSDSAGKAVICSLTSLVMRLLKASRSALLALFQVENGVNDAGSERGRDLARIRARNVALSGTSNTVARVISEKLRGVDQSVEPAGRTRQL
jgi:hypothetical protein